MKIDDTNSQFDLIAAEYLDRIQQGQAPAVEEYVEQYPEHAERIAELFPMIAMIEGSKRNPAKQESLPVEFLNDFRIIREIGRGGMGIVYEAEQQSLGRRVALKVLPRQMLLKEQNLLRFRREAKTAANLHHPSIVPVLGVGECEGYHYYVMQFINGAPLDEIIIRIRDLVSNTDRTSDGQRFTSHSSAYESANSAAGMLLNTDTATLAGTFVADAKTLTGDSMPGTSTGLPENRHDAEINTDRRENEIDSEQEQPRDVSVPASRVSDETPSIKHRKPELRAPYWRNVARIGVEAASALDCAHSQNVLHRDIKPGNILIDQQGNSWLADFGLAKAIDQDAVSRTGDVMGTLRYMSPEQSRGESDQRSDVYSLGVALYELLTLKSAFSDSRLPRAEQDPLPTAPSRIHAGVPRDLETIVMKAVEAHPDRRYQSAIALANDLQRFLDDRPIAARRASHGERLSRWCRKNPALATLTAIAAALLVTIVALSINSHIRTRALLASESQQREKAESTLKISLETLDKIYDQFAPTPVFESTSQTLDGTDLPVVTQPVVSSDTAAFLESLLTIYDQYAALDSKDLKLKIDSARALKRTGDIRLRLGDFPEAEAAYERALTSFDLLRQQENEPFDLYIAQIHNQIGLVKRFKGDRDARRQHHLAAYDLLSQTRLQADALKLEFARSCLQLGKKPDPLQGPPPENRGPPGRRHDGPVERPKKGNHFGPSENRNGPGSGKRPDGPPRQRRESELRYLDEAIELLREMMEESPRDPQPRLLVARCLRERANDAHSEDVDEALSILTGLVDEYPHVADFRFELSETLAMGDFRRAPRELLDSYAERLARAMEISSELDEQAPAFALAQIHIRHKLARVRFDQLREFRPPHDPEKVEQIRKLILKSVEQQTELSDRFPDVIPYRVWAVELKLSLLEVAVFPRRDRDIQRERELRDDIREMRDDIEEQLDLLQQDPQTERFAETRRLRFEHLASRID